MAERKINRECAFCDSTAKKTGEHVWSKWISRLLPGKKRLRRLDSNRDVIKRSISNTIDWKVPVVCHPCNTRWMSDIIENKHAKPAMSDLILDKPGPIDQMRANSIALFSFKTAVILDQLVIEHTPFFERSVRHEFKKSLTIPPDVGMWLTRFAPRGRGEANTFYNEGTAPEGGGIKMYVCTFSAEHLVLQIVAFKQFGLKSVATKDEFTAVPFWPMIEAGFTWPPSSCLRTASEFDAFSDRWLNIIMAHRPPNYPSPPQLNSP